MDLIDEEDRSLLGVGQVGQQVLRRRERRAAGDLQRDIQLPRDAGRERGLAKPRRPVEQHVPERLLPPRGGVDRDLDPLADIALPDDVAQSLRSQRDVVGPGAVRIVDLGHRRTAPGRGGQGGRASRVIFDHGLRCQDCLARHRRGPPWLGCKPVQLSRRRAAGGGQAEVGG